jgi:hypothetical protein
MDSGPYVQFASVGKITDGSIEIPTGLAPTILKELSEEIVSCQNPCTLARSRASGGYLLAQQGAS